MMMKVKIVALLGAFALALAVAAVYSGCGKVAPMARSHKLIVLGFDGMDPQILEQLMGEGKLPNFDRLRKKGGFRRLATSIPPQSPVAWSNFITGMGPGGHGIFDFIHRERETLLPYLSTSKIEGPARTIKLGGYIFPLSSGRARLLRGGKAFWQLLGAHGVPATVIMVPANFPPAEFEGKSISGMGTPDLMGTYGIFSYYTDSPPEKEEVAGGRIFAVEVKGDRVRAELLGPGNPFRQGSPNASADFTVWLDRENRLAKIELQGRELLLKEGEWSRWVEVRFEMLPWLYSISGICRFYLKEVAPGFKLYASPININPADPVLPISTPKDYAAEIAKELGYFYTQGIAEDTKALEAGVLDDGEFLEQSGLVMRERVKLFEHQLARFQGGLLFFYFSSIDQNSHVLWRAIDRNHPAYRPELAEKYGGKIAELYRAMDEMVGAALAKIEGDDTLIVMSDHGFAPFYRSFHLNSWLQREGYLKLDRPLEKDALDLFSDADWRRTRAYALGLNGLYLNLRGREPQGAVSPGSEAEKLLDEIAAKLLQLKDPKNGQSIVSRVYKAKEVYQGPYRDQAPDLIVGYNRGYRASWQTTLGAIPPRLIEDNTDRWSGDHCMAAELVPGVLLSNKLLDRAEPRLEDLAVTILAEFGVRKEDAMTGEDIFSRRSENVWSGKNQDR